MQIIIFKNKTHWASVPVASGSRRSALQMRALPPDVVAAYEQRFGMLGEPPPALPKGQVVPIVQEREVVTLVTPTATRLMTEFFLSHFLKLSSSSADADESLRFCVETDDKRKDAKVY